MTDEKIFEIAHIYGTYEALHYEVDQPTQFRFEWIFEAENLIAFAQSVIEAERDLTTIKVPTVIFDKLKDVNTVTDLINALKAAEKTE